jgi:hypothetical protein
VTSPVRWECPPFTGSGTDCESTSEFDSTRLELIQHVATPIGIVSPPKRLACKSPQRRPSAVGSGTLAFRRVWFLGERGVYLVA